MAIDTRRKRQSVASIGLMVDGPSPSPNESITQGDRQTIGYSYAGIAATGFSGAYDSISSLVHLYEPARRGVSSYLWDLVRLERASDNAERDFGPDASGDLDTSAISTWIGGSSATVVTVYDQITDGDDPTQATTADQPVYKASGQNGKPVMDLDGTNHFLVSAFTSALSQPFSLYAVATMDTAAVNDNTANYMVSGDDVANVMVMGQNAIPSPDEWAIYSGSFLNGGSSNDSPSLWAALFNGASSEFWINDTSKATGDAGTQNADGITIGGLSTGANHWPGDIAMIAIADPSHNDTVRGNMQTAINNYWAVYSTGATAILKLINNLPLTALVDNGLIG